MAYNFTTSAPFGEGGTGYGVARSDSLGIWCAVGFTDSSGDIRTSEDGIIWISQGNPFNSGGGGSPADVCWIESLNLFIAVGSSNDQTILVCTSPDGENWTPRTTPWDTTGYIISVGTDGTTVVAVGSDAGDSLETLLYSTNGTSWTSVSTPLDSDGITGGNAYVIHYSDIFAAWFLGGQGPAAAGYKTFAWAESPDDTWTQVDTPFDGEAGTVYSIKSGLQDAVTGVILCAGNNPANTFSVMRSYDYGTFETLETPFDTDSGQGVAYKISVVPVVPDVNDKFVVVGAKQSDYSSAIISTEDGGETWIDYGNPILGESGGLFYSLDYSSDLEYYCFVGFSSGTVHAAIGDLVLIIDTGIEFAFDGTKYVRAIVHNSIEDQTYSFYGFGIVNASGTGNGGDLIIKSYINEPFVQGDTFWVALEANSFGDLGVSILEYGTPGGPFEFNAVWNFDGDTELSAEFFAENGVTYRLFAYIVVDNSEFQTGSSEPTWPTGYGDPVSDGDYAGYNSGNLWTWAPNTPVVPDPNWGRAVIFKGGWIWLANFGGGTTGSSEPSWGTGGGFRTDGTVSWSSFSPAHVWSVNQHYAEGYSTYIIPTSPQNEFFNYIVGQQLNPTIDFVGDGSIQTLTLDLLHTPISSFSAFLYRF